MSTPRRGPKMRRTVRTRVTLLLVAAAATAVAVLALWPGEPELDRADAASVATGWVGAGAPQTPRRDGDEWEVDVVRPNGSLVEVTVGGRGELLGFDEERGPGGSRAPDELTGPSRARAARAALAATGPGRVLSAEWEQGGGIEVAVRRADGTQVEVGLDQRLRVREIEREDPADE
ncbi:MAG TPA: hypothetical protein VE270_06005 [Thermoleophilaceae bacterium]|nr:hypothetical protein [Thermoleophilaceae bacterium]